MSALLLRDELFVFEAGNAYRDAGGVQYGYAKAVIGCDAPANRNTLTAWRCDTCGSFHFKLLPEGAQCAQCRTWVIGWADA